MKYQIYLNKETTTFIELFAKTHNMRPSTVIKQIVEGTYLQAMDYAREELKKKEEK